MYIYVFKKGVEKLQWVDHIIAVLQYFLKPKDAFANALQDIMSRKEI